MYIWARKSALNLRRHSDRRSWSASGSALWIGTVDRDCGWALWMGTVHPHCASALCIRTVHTHCASALWIWTDLPCLCSPSLLFYFQFSNVNEKWTQQHTATNSCSHLMSSIYWEISCRHNGRQTLRHTTQPTWTHFKQFKTHRNKHCGLLHAPQ